MDHMSERESIFIVGIDPSIKESDIKEFFGQVVRTIPVIRFHYYSVLNKPRSLVEVLLPVNDAILAHQHLNNAVIKGFHTRLIPKNSMKALIITNLPTIISEKDLFLIVSRITPGLKRVIIADDPEICGKTLGLAVASYHTYEYAKDALEILKNNNHKIFEKVISAVWKDPTYDVIGELAYDTRVLYVKSIAGETTVERLREIFSRFGKILTIKKLAQSAYIEYTDVQSAKKALEHCQGKRFDGLAWRIYPAKKLDEEKAKENPDKNIIFSKSFLEQTDQQVLLKFAFDGTLPGVDPQVLQMASNVIDAAKNFQRTLFEKYRENYEGIMNQQNHQNHQNHQNPSIQVQPLVQQNVVNPQVNNVPEVVEDHDIKSPNENKGLSKNQKKKLAKQQKMNKMHQNQMQNVTKDGEVNSIGLGQNYGGNGVQQQNNMQNYMINKASVENVPVNYGNGASNNNMMMGGINNQQQMNGYGQGTSSPFARNGQNYGQGFQNKF